MNRTFILSGPLSLVLYQGQLGLWSRNERAERICVWLDPHQTALLTQFSRGPQHPAQAAAAAGVEYDAGVEELVQQLLHHRILCEHVEPCEDPYHPLHHPDRDDAQPDCVVDPGALDEAGVHTLLEELWRSKLIGGNALSDGFGGSRGFGVKFRREGLSRLLEWLPFTRPYFARIFHESEAHLRFRQALGGQPPNAFFFNALVIPPGKGVALHFDRTLDNRTAAMFVSVLYLQVTAQPGGRLFLYDGAWPVGMVNPRSGMLIQFRGALRHGVSDTAPSDGERISLVCEHYFLPDAALRQCPYFELVMRE